MKRVFNLLVVDESGSMSIIERQALVYFRQASHRICNPVLKNVLTYLCSADLQSAAEEHALLCWGITNPPV